MPTFSALAKTPLPADRQYDGLDLSPVLFAGAELPNRTLFHQDGEAHLNAMRYGRYKIFFKTASARPCRFDNGSHAPEGTAQAHSPPLVFDVVSDQAEATPLALPAHMYALFAHLREQKLYDIATTFSSFSNYSRGDHQAWPCCNPASSCCRCRSQQ